jgi:hypothetical protein
MISGNKCLQQIRGGKSKSTIVAIQQHVESLKLTFASLNVGVQHVISSK